MPDSGLQYYAKTKESTIHHALQQWRTGWPNNLLDFEPLPERPSLYQDRAAAYWYLAGIIMLPYVVMSSPKTTAVDEQTSLSVQDALEHLMLLSDQGLLCDLDQDFDATYHLLMGHLYGGRSDRALGTLIYREETAPCS